MEKRFASMRILISLVMLAVAVNSVSAGVVYFYEGKAAGEYKMAAFSQLVKELQANGHDVKILQADLSIENLRSLNPSPDVLIIPNLAGDLTVTEMRALFELSMKDGKSVLIMGASSAASKITVPMGMIIPEQVLEDEKSKVRDAGTGQLVEDKSTFFVDLPSKRDDPIVGAMTRDISKLNVFGANGIYIFGGNTKAIVTGGDTASTPKSPLIFPEKSYPPIVTYTRVGKGSFVIVTDPDMFTDKNLDTKKYRNDNLKLAANIVDWLSIPPMDAVTDDERDNVLKFLKTENDNLNRTLMGAKAQNDQLNADKGSLSDDNSQLKKENDRLKAERVPGTDITYFTLGLFLLAGCFLLTTLVVLRKGKKGKEKEEQAKKDADGELGYEFEDKSLTKNGKIKEEDVEERLKELQKTSK